MNFSQQQEMYAQVVQKCWDDPVFKQKLVSNPVATIEAEIGAPLDLPKGKTLVVRDQTDNSTIYINIPAANAQDTELSEEQLEMVSGGTDRKRIIWEFEPSVIGCFPTSNETS